MPIKHWYWHLVVSISNFTLLLTSSGQEWQFHIATDIATEISIMRPHIFQMLYAIIVVQAHFGRSRFQMQCSTQSDISPHLSDEVTKMRCEMKYPDKQSVIPPNLSDEMTKIRSEMKSPERLSDIPPSTNIEFSGLAISHCYWHLVVKNGNFTLQLPSSCQEWQFHIATDI